VRTRLQLVSDWPALAHTARYNCDHLASLCSVSKRQLERFFMDRFNQTPKDWMQSLRMCNARQLIQRGFSTKAAAAELSYGGPCQFCRKFKAHHGNPPQHFAPMLEGRVLQTMSPSVHSRDLKKP
jgi:transcriptional regulator GlxA family with amidase domain